MPGHDADAPRWGVLPDAALALLRRREWDNPARLKARLLGEHAFPIRLPLKPPSAAEMLSDLTHFQRFVDEWKRFAHPDSVQWQVRTYRQLGEQRVPTALLVSSIEVLTRLLGSDARARCADWEPRFSPILAAADDGFRSSLYSALIRQLERVERLSIADAELLARLLPQLTRGMGIGLYLRALPLQGVDTKFLEGNAPLIDDLMNVLNHGEVAAMGGLVPWLGCSDYPRGWLLVKPLCGSAREAMGGFPVLQLPTQVLMGQGLPASRILVVENLQSGLALPDIPDTIAVAGGGRNVGWLAGAWLRDRYVGYWGDIDTWGLRILSDARAPCPHLQALLMDASTLDVHQARRVGEPEPVRDMPGSLTDAESELFQVLLDGGTAHGRLEQERLSSDWVVRALEEWGDGERPGQS